MARRITTLVAPAGTPGGVTGGSSALVPISTCVGDDEGHGSDQQFDRVTRVVTFEVGVTLTFASTPNQNCTIYFSTDSGTTFFWQGPRLWTASGQKIKFDAARPTTVTSCAVAAVPGSITGDPSTSILSSGLPAGRIISAVFSVAALALPPAVIGTSISFDAGAAGNWPYNKQTPDKTQYFEVTGITVTSPNAYSQTDTWAIAVTVEDLDATGAMAGVEHIFAQVGVTSGPFDLNKLDGSYGTDGYSYTRSGNLAALRFRVYGLNRVDQTTAAWQNAAASTLYTDVGGGAGYADVVVAVGGVPPPGEVVNTGQGSSFSFSSFFDPGFEQCVPGSVIDPLAVTWGPGNLVSAAWFYDCPSPGVITIYASGGNNGGQYCGLKGASVRVGQMLTTQPGASHFMACYLKSTNNASTNHELRFKAVWIDGAGATISTTNFQLAVQYIPAWSFISGFLTAPAGASTVFFYFETGASEPSTDEWFIDDLKVEGTIQQTANNQTTTTVPVAGATDYSALRALSSINASKATYGKDQVELLAADGSVVRVSCVTGQIIMRLEAASGDWIQAQLVGGALAIGLFVGGVLYVGQDTTISGHSFKKGICVS